MGHWGRLFCAHADRDGCQLGVNSTPRNARDHARQIMPGSTAALAPDVQTMTTFEFSIIASGLDPEADDFESRFYEAGCDDATVAFQKGHVILDFAREAASSEEAIESAVSAVRRAGATVDRVEPDPLVSLSDIAARSGLSRAAITHFAAGERGANFPPSVARITTSSPLWQWADVSRWLVDRGSVTLDVWEQAVSVMRANARLHEVQRAAEERAGPDR